MKHINEFKVKNANITVCNSAITYTCTCCEKHRKSSKKEVNEKKKCI